MSEKYLVVHDGTKAQDAEMQVVLLAEQTRVSQSFPEEKTDHVKPAHTSLLSSLTET